MEREILLQSLRKKEFPFLQVTDTETQEILLDKKQGDFVKCFLEEHSISALFEVHFEKMREKNMGDLAEYEEREQSIILKNTFLGKTFDLFHDSLGLTYCLMEFPSKMIRIAVGAYRTNATMYRLGITEKHLEKLPHLSLHLVESKYHDLHQEILSCLFVKGEQDLKEIIEYLQEDFSISHTLNDLEKKFHLSERTIQRRFKEHLNTTFFKFYQEMRMHYARRLLRDTKYSIDEIALKVGYESSANFYNAFHAYYGCPPRHYYLQPTEEKLWQN
ncbi:Helix-turn-helix domain-containing protein [Pilibacter termitis]|uniref:Helix-turn-helix domain-containing protein n=1 Tax=Pilibacter termitis TaxID=263852 RepID=A0A1T4LNF6_9ENTE|nr:AraC family transcriptional regulator [Pilibacter termitis]SJZ56147.1 Helix-turn-helix domain-containing protein [Pilibacter termitis]